MDARFFCLSHVVTEALYRNWIDRYDAGEAGIIPADPLMDEFACLNTGLEALAELSIEENR